MKTIELFSDTKELAPFREKLRKELGEAHVPDKNIADIVLAVDEGLTNIIRHAYDGDNQRKIQVNLDIDEEAIQITLCDSGKKFDPTLRPDPELPPTKPGGLGIHFMRKLMDKVEYDKEFQDGNRLKLTKFVDWINSK